MQVITTVNSFGVEMYQYSNEVLLHFMGYTARGNNETQRQFHKVDAITFFQILNKQNAN